MNNKSATSGKLIQDIPQIKPVPSGIKRPLWSVMIPTYNCAHFLGQALESVLCQDPGEDVMQIEVVDNQSTDCPEAVVERIGKGRIKFYRNSENLGPYRNFNVCIERSVGHLVHILHGDDYVMNGFYQQMKELSEKVPQASLLSCRCVRIDEEGEILELSPRVPELEVFTRNPQPQFYRNQLECATVVIRREFYEKFGGFNLQLIHTADWEMWFRAILKSGGVMLNKPLAAYRIHAGSETHGLKKTGENLKDYLKCAQAFVDHGADFDFARFRSNVSRFAEGEMLFFKKMGDCKTASLYRQVWKEAVFLKQDILFPFKKSVLKLLRRIYLYFSTP